MLCPGSVAHGIPQAQRLQETFAATRCRRLSTSITSTSRLVSMRTKRSRLSADHACLPYVWDTHFNLYRQVRYRALSCLCVDRMICPSARKWRCYSASEWQPIPQTIRKMLSKKYGRLAMMRDVFSIVRLTTSFGDQSTRRMRGKLRRLLKCTL